MSKYHLGDKFVVEIKEVLESNNGTLYRSNFSTLVFDDYGLDKLQKYDEIGRRLELIDELKQAEYNKGLQDAWDLARKIVCHEEHGGMSLEETENVFGTAFPTDILEAMTAEEALAKIEAYEREKEIKVGDVVQYGVFTCVVTALYNQTADVLFKDGTFGVIKKSKAKKTGKRIDIEGLLRQIGE